MALGIGLPFVEDSCAVVPKYKPPGSASKVQFYTLANYFSPVAVDIADREEVRLCVLGLVIHFRSSLSKEICRILERVWK
jgi:hypothetical protein